LFSLSYEDSRRRYRRGALTHDDLIYDVGVNDGRDTEFYLFKGFRVIGVEANPTIYASVREKFAPFIKTGQFVLLNVGIWPEASDLIFYVNLDNHHWSSFDAAHGCRNNTRFETVLVKCISSLELIRRFGVPYYMKIDVEAADKHIVTELRRAPERPRFISIEEYGVTCFDALRALGYQLFQIVPQWNKRATIPPIPPREGTYVPRIFDGNDSGLFGRELAGEWKSYADVRKQYLETIRNEKLEYVGLEHEWYDVHATT
jgi:FkbM family methyltransferase